MGLAKKIRKKKRKIIFYEVLWPVSIFFSTLDEISLSETSFKSILLIYICKWKKVCFGSKRFSPSYKEEYSNEMQSSVY